MDHHMTNRFGNFKYRRQFIAGPDKSFDFPSWSKVSIGSNLSVLAHPDTRITQSASGENIVVCIGVMIHSQQSHTGIQTVVDVLARATTFADIEETAASCAGRWLLIVKLGSEIRVYPDASALLPVFYTKHDCQTWFASQPRLLQETLRLEPDNALIDKFFRHKHGSSWPGGITTVTGVSQLWPNHYLQYEDAATKRFWPNKNIQPIDMEQAAKQVANRLKLIMENVAQLQTIRLWLTGGYDSRVVFSVSRHLHGEMEFCVLDNYKNASFDRTIAAKLAKLSDSSVMSIRPRRATKEFWKLLRENGGNMAYDPMNFTCNSRNDQAEGRLHVFGWTGEVGRCFYYTDGKKPSKIDASTLCELIGHKENPVSKEVMKSWLDSVGEINLSARGIDILDLLYWEHRLGAWASMMSLVRETFTETMAPFNCREVFEIMLGTEMQYRTSPFELFRKICELTYPETLTQPFNWSRRSAVVDKISGVIPWRIRDFSERVLDYRWGVIRKQIHR